MDSLTQTSLEALLLKATTSKSQNVDTAAVEAFCTLVQKEKDGAHIGAKVIATRLISGDEKEMLQTLNMLDTCMGRCGLAFQGEVGKFRFLNEMIKLVSPKYLGSHTPIAVKQKVLQLLYLWTLDYPKEMKIKEAYDMLRKQGVIKEIPNANIILPRKKDDSVFHDEEKSKILQKLLQSKDPEDIQAANWLIKSMVKEDDKRAELTSLRISELESVQNNARLLGEMLDCYQSGVSSSEELDLINELYQSCERLKPNLLKLATGTQANDKMLNDVLQTSDELGQVFAKYDAVIMGKRLTNATENSSLLDLECLDLNVTSIQDEVSLKYDVLNEIFATPNMQTDVLQPVTVESAVKTFDQKITSTPASKSKALDELDLLSKQLIRQSLAANNDNVNKHGKNSIKPLAESLGAEGIGEPNCQQTQHLNNCAGGEKNGTKDEPTANVDDCLVDITEEFNNGPGSVPKQTALKLSDIFIRMEDIRPSTKTPIKIIDDHNGITVTLHHTKDKPREDVRAYVITTTNTNEQPLTNYLFQAVVPKGCKLKLQPPSRTDLPAYNPFLPPAAITQIMLISSQESDLFLKCILSFAIDDETCNEMGEIESLLFD